MKKSLFLLALPAYYFVTICSCKKPDKGTDLQTDIPDKQTAIAYMAGAAKTPQHFTVTAGTNSKFLAAEGTILKFYPNSFKDKYGNPILSGTIDISITELYKLGEIGGNQTSTITKDGKVLVTGGEVNITATMNGQEVFANKYGLGFKAASSAPAKPMELYYGEKDEDGIVNWNVTSSLGTGSAVSGTEYVTDTNLKLLEIPYYMFDSATSFKWTNCDHPYDQTAKMVTISLQFPKGSKATQYSNITLVYPSLNVALSMFGSAYGDKVMYNGYAPIGPNCKVIFSACKSNTTFYYDVASSSTTISDGMTLNITPTVVTTEELKAKMKEW